jgi:hypothetical protein
MTDKWRPMASAPSDGTKFLAVTRKGRMRVDWLDAALSTSQNAHEWANDPYTHWMPLPERPCPMAQSGRKDKAG